MSVTCPCCGAKNEGSGLLIDAESGIVANEHGEVHLSPAMMRIFCALSEAHPRVVATEKLLDAMERSDQADYVDPRKALNVFIYKLRSVLKHIGVAVNVSWGFGYYLSGEVRMFRSEIAGGNLNDEIQDLFKRGFTANMIAARLKQPYEVVRQVVAAAPKDGGAA